MVTVDPATRCYPCPWCQEPDRWPDMCSENNSRCVRVIERQCMNGDHRKCAIDACTVSTRCHRPVRDAGTAAAQAAGKVWAVVSTIENDVRVLGTSNHLGQAKLLLRTTVVNAGNQDNDYVQGMVYIVRGAGGAFL